jgi:hypothetical protein
MKRFLFSSFALLLAFSSVASQLLGGEITWECNANGTFTFQVVLFRDCSGAPLTGSTVDIAWNGSSMPIVCTAADTTFISSGAITCSSNAIFTPVERYLFRSAPVVIPGPVPSGGYHFTVSRSGRPNTNNTTNGSSNGFLLRAVMYPYVQGGIPQNTNPCFDSSPQFGEVPRHAFNTTDQNFAVTVADPNSQDSVYMTWAEPWTDGSVYPGTALTYDTGYAFNQPLPGVNFNSANIPISLQRNGLVNFKSLTTGRFTVCQKAESWRNGQKIAEVFRDFEYQVNVDPGCSGICGNSPNNNPTLVFSGQNTPSPVFINGALAYYQLSAFPGDSISFSMLSQDADLQPNCSPQSITANGIGPSLNHPNTGAGCTNAPCATLTSLNSGGSFVNALSNSVRFDWVPDTNHAVGAVGEGIHDFHFSMTDNHCVLSGVTNAMVRIRVLRPIYANAGVLGICDGDTANITISGDVSNLSWSPATDISCTNCASPQIYPTTSTVYTVTDLNSGYAIDFDIQVSPAIPSPQFNVSGNGFVVTNGGDYDTITWRRNFAPFYPNPSSAYTPFLAGSYWVEARSGVCAVESFKLSRYFVDNLAATNDTLGTWHDEKSESITHGCTFSLEGEPWYGIDGIYVSAFANNQQNDLTAVSCKIYDQQQNVVFQSDSVARITDDVIRYYGKAQLQGSQDYLMAIYTDTSLTVPTYKPASWPVVANNQRVLVLNAATAPGDAIPTVNADDYPFFHIGLEWQIGLEEAQLPKFAVYPNPADSWVYFASNVAFTFELMNSLGGIIKRGKIDQQGTLNVSDISAGVYIIKAYFNDGSTAVKRLVKQ